EFPQSTIKCRQALALCVSRMLASPAETVMDVSDENFLRVGGPRRHRLQRGPRERARPDPGRPAQNALSIRHQGLFRRLSPAAGPCHAIRSSRCAEEAGASCRVAVLYTAHAGWIKPL